MKTSCAVHLCMGMVLTLAGSWAGVEEGMGPARAGAAEPVVHSSFMSPHAAPIVVSSGRVFVVNTPADTVDVIDSRTHEVVARVPVGIDPVGLAVRPGAQEVWVANHISDSVSVIDTDPANPTCLQVVATLQDFDPKTKATQFDEPVGIAFASNEKAYVALSAENAIAVVDARTRKITRRLAITAQDPRAITVRGDRLYVIPFESNNKTQLSGGGKPLDGKLKTFDAYEHSIRNNNVLSLGHVVDIVKHPRVPDRDLYVFDTRSDRLVEVVDTLGTLLYGLTVDSTGRVFIAQTDARNDANGKSGTRKHGLKELENRAFLNQVTRVTFQDGAAQAPEFIALEPLPPHHPEPSQALATPYAIEVSQDDSIVFVTAAGSDKLFAIQPDSGEVIGRVDVGAVPRGIALESTGDGKASHAWVFNAVGNTVSLVDVADPAALSVMAEVRLEDPTDADVKRGRVAFNTAAASTTGTYSCASCHPDGHTDQLLWVLNTPVVTGGNQIMPRSTMPVRGLRDTEPYHWDGIPGDPYGGNNSANIRKNVKPNSQLGDPESSARHLIDGGLANTMMRVGDLSKNDEGKAGNLSARDRDAMAKFILSVTYPPAQRRAYTNVVSRRARKGFELFHVKGDVERDKPRANVCGDCHRMPFLVSTNTPGTGMDAPTWRGAYDRWLILPQGRLNMIDFEFFRRIAERGTPERRVWQMSWGSRRRFNPVWDMVLENSTGFSGSFGRQVTLSRDSVKVAVTGDLLDALERSAREGAVVLQGQGVFLEGGKGTSVTLLFDTQQDHGTYVSLADRSQVWTSGQLRSLAAQGQFLATLTAGLADAVDFDHPQPALWTLGAIESQRGRQRFPVVRADRMKLTASSRHVQEDARVFVDGRHAEASVRVDDATVGIELAKLPVAGMHLLQVQNPGGMFSNDFIFYASGTGEEMQLAGTWQLAVESKSRPRRPHRHTLRISREEGQWSVEYRTSRSEGEQARDVTLTGTELSFKVARGRNVTGFYRGTIAGDFISGSLEYIEGKRVVGRREFSGARQTR